MHGIAVHGHFYQPPREDPWLGAVLKDETAFPTHDWNRRIARECYLPNAFSTLRNEKGKIVRITNNYAHLSFNFGPTLHEWIQHYEPELSQCLKESNRASLQSWGSGNALAQAYNHMILPLASGQDKITQIRWGIQDYLHRYGEKPEGMWLPETAVDTPTLEALAREGILFTILAPSQCAAAQKSSGEWKETPYGTGLETRVPYLVELPSSQSMAVFFYDGQLSHSIAFGDLLHNGDAMGQKLLSRLHPEKREEPSFLLVATDGETYGHHHHFSEMALSRAFRVIQESSSASLMPPGAFLKKYPPRRKARIAEKSSWSCVHGVERWRSNCGCSTGGDPSWNQAWRAPLRQAFDNLREGMDAHFEKMLLPFCDDPWKLRDESIALLLDTPRKKFFQDRFGSLPEEAERSMAVLLEAQRMGMYMYTSCAWFFNDISGVETLQNIKYAFRGAQLLTFAGGPDLSDKLLEDLALAKGNTPALPDARAAAEKKVLPFRKSLRHIAADAMMAGEKTAYYSYNVTYEKLRDLPQQHGRAAELTVEDPRIMLRWKGCAFCIHNHSRMPLAFAEEHLALEDIMDELSKTPWQNWIRGSFPNPPREGGALPPDDRDALCTKWEAALRTAASPWLHQFFYPEGTALPEILEEKHLFSPLIKELTAEYFEKRAREFLQASRFEDFLLLLESIRNFSQKNSWLRKINLSEEVEAYFFRNLETPSPEWERMAREMESLEPFKLEYAGDRLLRKFWIFFGSSKHPENPLHMVAQYLGFAV